MQNRKIAVVTGAAVVAIVLWGAFRPERLFIDKNVNEDFPVAKAGATELVDRFVPLSAGSFHDVHHETSGKATIYETTGGKRVLRLTEFETSNGPDVQVYLVAADDAVDNETVTSAGFVHVGALKGNIGDQNYDLDSTIDLSKYRAVTIWCRRFGVNFGTAPLELQG